MKRFLLLFTITFCLHTTNTFAYDFLYTDDNNNTWECTVLDETSRSVSISAQQKNLYDDYRSVITTPEVVFDKNNSNRYYYVNQVSCVLNTYTWSENEGFDSNGEFHELHKIIISDGVTSIKMPFADAADFVKDVNIYLPSTLSKIVPNSPYNSDFFSSCWIETENQMPLHKVNIYLEPEVHSLIGDDLKDKIGLNNVFFVEPALNDGIYTFNTDSYNMTATLDVVDDKSLDDFVIPSVTSRNSLVYDVTGIGDSVFYLCDNLNSIELPSQLQSIGKLAFAGCSNLSSVTSYAETPLTFGLNAFNGISSNCTLSVPYGTRDAYIAAGWTESVFKGGVIEMEQDIPDNNIIFQDTIVKSICVANWDTDDDGELSYAEAAAVTDLGQVFYGKSITSFIELQYFTGITSIGDRAFYSCSSLTSINIPESVTSIGNYAFYKCSSLTSINIPESVTSIGSDAFDYCNLSKIVIPNIQSWCAISFINDFSNPLLCGPSKHLYSDETTEITELVIPEGVTAIPVRAFFNCSSLTSVTIPEGVTSIGDWAFLSCYNLTSINIPSSVTSIGTMAFENINEYIYFQNSVPISQFDKNSYAVLIVPDEAVNDYRTAWPDYANNIIGASALNEFSVTVSAKDNTSDLAEQIGENNLMNIMKLKLSGTINSYDMMILRNKMINLRKLNLLDVTIVANPYEYYTGCSSHDNEVGANFFRNTKVVDVILPSTGISIGENAFMSCRALISVNIPEGVKNIGNNAFLDCENLKSIHTPSTLETIGSSVFNECYKLENVSLNEGLQILPDLLFQDCISLTSIVIPSTVKEIQTSCFDGCSKLADIKISPKTTIIANSSFYGCTSLTDIKLPPYLQTIYDYAFSRCSNLKDIYAYMVDVPAISTNTFNDYQHQNLYVPEFLYNSYYYDTNWSQFLSVNICDLKPGDYEAFYANSDVYFEPGVERITEDTPEVELGEHGGIIVEGEEQHFGDVHQGADGDGDSSSLIADGEDDGSNNNMPINKLFVDIKVKANRWYFFCFPFDVTIADCDYPGRYVWRHYDGAIRALLGSGGWQPVAGSKLEARKGYIFQSSAAGTLTVKFDRPTFGGERPKDLEVHACDNAANASWNFVGNPYSCYYDFQEEDFTSPITVWNGSSYEAYRPGDDEYHLQPYEAFFVQKPEAAEQINFEPERRETYWQIQKKAANGVKSRQAKGINPNRLILNLTAGAVDSEQTDRMRLVLNEQASRSYELECDAAKFLSNEAPVQLYSVEGENTMAINERPMDGDIRLGFVAKNAGTFRISAPRMDIPMMLVDNETGTTFDLSLGDYEFQTVAGTNNTRFMLKPSDETTAIRTLKKDTGVAVGLQEGGLSIGGAEGKTVSIHTTSGALAAQHSGNGFVSLPRGSYIVKVADASAKVYVK